MPGARDPAASWPRSPSMASVRVPQKKPDTTVPPHSCPRGPSCATVSSTTQLWCRATASATRTDNRSCPCCAAPPARVAMGWPLDIDTRGNVVVVVVVVVVAGVVVVCLERGWVGGGCDDVFWPCQPSRKWMVLLPSPVSLGWW